ncbi:hypothetical protein [Sandaracinus amylolyticus]|uniref:Transmembrane protein n=1 Tax=Sandaracinus amylolyticus TaxID=927083 RepID=A0A0F6W2R5_9BACT|nr:hypothetical protein [Sandaracinus amylolyticus]AKF05790.1 hypothetical protein DB32_002939 [Sandaracinus amylolyticus]
MSEAAVRTEDEALSSAEVPSTTSSVGSRTAATAEAALRSVSGGLQEATRRFDAEREDWQRFLARSELPDVRGEDPIAELAVRVDREADFWRSVAVRAMRPGASRSIAIGATLVGLTGGLGLSLLGGIRGLFGTDATAGQLWAAAGALALGVALALAAAAWLDRTAARAAGEALARADAAEKRLQRIAALLALRRADASAFRDALERLERG